MCAFPCSSVPIFKNLPEETLTKISDVLEEVSERVVYLAQSMNDISHIKS